jgi:hypothetical protein
MTHKNKQKQTPWPLVRDTFKHNLNTISVMFLITFLVQTQLKVSETEDWVNPPTSGRGMSPLSGDLIFLPT